MYILMTDFDTADIIPEQVKTTIGRLIVVIASEADPAKKIHYTSALISEIRSALKLIIRYWRIESLDKMMWDLVRAMVVVETNDSVEYQKAMLAIQRMYDRFNGTIPVMDKNGHRVTPEAEAMALITLNNYYTVLSCRKRWQESNRIYFTNPDAWQYSNAMLADIHDVLIDIANHHKMIIIPKNTFFSIDEINNYGTSKPLGDEKHG